MRASGSTYSVQTLDVGRMHGPEVPYSHSAQDADAEVAVEVAVVVAVDVPVLVGEDVAVVVADGDQQDSVSSGQLSAPSS